MPHALQGSTALGIQLAPQHPALLSRGWEKDPVSPAPARARGTWVVGGLRQVTQAAAQPNREAAGAARDMCRNSRGQSLAPGY